MLVIDIQQDLTGDTAKPPYPYKGAESLIKNVNSTIDMAKDKQYPIIYIRQEYKNNLLDTPFSGGRLISGSAGAEFNPSVKVLSNDMFVKFKSDAFSNEQLGEFLVNNKINHLYVTGIDAAACVYNTSKGGLNRGYQVTAIDDCVITMDMRNMDAILALYKKDGISVISSTDFSALS